METTNASYEARFARVSSLYGPGTIAAWYFTMLSVLVSWTLHPRKQKSGSIDVNLVAILALPAVAAGHVVWQGQLLPRHFADLNEEGLIPLVAAIEAPFIVTETYMAISVILFLIAAWTYCIRRATLVALISLECFSVEGYVHMFSFKYRYRPGTLAKNFPAFSRPFVADFTAVLVVIIVMLGLLVLISGLLTMIMLSRSKTTSTSAIEDVERTSHARATRDVGDVLRSSIGAAQSGVLVGVSISAQRSILMAQANQDASTRAAIQQTGATRGREMYFITYATTLFLPVSFAATVWPTFWHSASYWTSEQRSLWDQMKDFALRFGRDFFPRTTCSISDLDQAFAAVAGAMALAFSVYSVAKAYYKIWDKAENDHNDRSSSRGTTAVFELNPLEHRSRCRSL